MEENHSIKLLYIFAILLRDNPNFKLSSMVEKVLIYSWVIGAMFLCFTYNSIFLSFLMAPPVIKMRDVPPQTAMANGRYHCITISGMRIYTDLLKSSKLEDLQMLGTHIERDNLSS